MATPTTSAKTSTTPRKRKAKKKPETDYVALTKEFLKSPKTRQFLGIAALFFALYLLLAFLSYPFSWKTDQQIYEDGWLKIMQKSREYDHKNWMGNMGAIFAHQFIHKWFGISSFGFIFLTVVFGMRLLYYKLYPLRRTLVYSLIAMIWLSITLSYLFGDSLFSLGGAHGIFMSRWLNDSVGKVGTFFLLLFILIGFTLAISDKALVYTLSLIKSRFSAEQSNPVGKFLEKIIRKKETKIEEESDEESENEEDTTQTTEKREKKNKPDTESATVIKKEFILNDNGKKVSARKELNFEIENTRTTNSDRNENEIELDNSFGEFSIPSDDTQFTDNEVEGRLSLKVEKNQDVLVDELNNEMKDMEPYDPCADLSNYRFPTLDLLEDHKSYNSEVSNEELINNKNRIVETLLNYKIEITKIKATIGPTVTLYEIIPAPGVRISKIKNLEDDIALSLSALGIRIIAPMPGRGTIGIEVPNQKPEIVSMRSVVASAKFQESKFELPIALGKTISNETYIADLTKMPHLLVAGATGQGKSVGLNAIIASLLYKKHPAQVKFVFVDPKKVELTLYEKIEKHFLAKLPDMDEAIITNNQQVIQTLSSLTVEMENRYNLLKAAAVRNIKEYNEKFINRRLNPNKGHHYMPYIVLVIDEFADLIMTAGKEVEMPLARLAQLARAIGIHLIVATQRPSTNIITGVIKANFPTRLAFKVASMIDSRTILDSPGANQLIGRGDMLITQGSDMIRLQCAFIDTPELDKITDHISKQQGYSDAFLLPEPRVEGAATENTEADTGNRDEFFEDAARLIVIHQQGSTSLIQRKMSIGYNRAGRIMDQLEKAGIVGPPDGSKPRQVLYTDEMSLENYLRATAK